MRLEINVNKCVFVYLSIKYNYLDVAPTFLKPQMDLSNELYMCIHILLCACVCGVYDEAQHLYLKRGKAVIGMIFASFNGNYAIFSLWLAKRIELSPADVETIFMLRARKKYIFYFFISHIYVWAE